MWSEFDSHYYHKLKWILISKFKIMNKLKLLALGFVVAGGLSAQTNQCEGVTKSNNQCKNTVKNGNLCYLHNPNYVKTEDTKSVICNGTTQKNQPCKNKTKDVSGFCHNHKD